MSWDAYESRATAEWQALLNSSEGCDERKVHHFLAKHPSFVPGVFGMTEGSRLVPYYWALFSESPLREWDHANDCYRDVPGIKIPDFMWLNHDSQNFSPVLIEIESPCKTWFTDHGEPHHDLMQALNQLAKWRAWLKRRESAIALYSSFGASELHRCTFRPKYLLIYGRETELQDRRDFNRLHSQFQQEDQIVMTFDCLKPARDDSGFICATKTAERYRAVSVPPTMRLGPRTAGWCRIPGLPEAIMANEWISPERRKFLIEHLW